MYIPGCWLFFFSGFLNGLLGVWPANLVALEEGEWIWMVGMDGIVVGVYIEHRTTRLSRAVCRAYKE